MRSYRSLVALCFAGCGLTLDLDPPDPGVDGAVVDGGRLDATEDGAADRGEFDVSRPDGGIEAGDGNVDAGGDVINADGGEPSCVDEPFPLAVPGAGETVRVTEPEPLAPQCGVFFTPVEYGDDEDADGDSGDQCEFDVNYAPESCSRRAPDCDSALPEERSAPITCAAGGAEQDLDCDGVLDAVIPCIPVTAADIGPAPLPLPSPGTCTEYLGLDGTCPGALVFESSFVFRGGTCPSSRTIVSSPAECVGSERATLLGPIRIQGEVMLERVRVIDPSAGSDPTIFVEDDAHLILQDSEVDGGLDAAIVLGDRARLTVLRSRVRSGGDRPTIEARGGAVVGIIDSGSRNAPGVFNTGGEPAVYLEDGATLRGLRSTFRTVGSVAGEMGATIRVRDGRQIDLVESTVHHVGAGAFRVVDLDGCERAVIADAEVYGSGEAAGVVVGVHADACPLSVQSVDASRFNTSAVNRVPMITGLREGNARSSVGLSCQSGSRCRLWRAFVAGAGANGEEGFSGEARAMRCIGDGACEQIADSLLWGQLGARAGEPQAVVGLEMIDSKVRIGRSRISGGPSGRVTALDVRNGSSVDLHDSLVIAFASSDDEADPDDDGIAVLVRTGELRARHNLFAVNVEADRVPLGCAAARVDGGRSAFLSNVFVPGNCDRPFAFVGNAQRFMVSNVSVEGNDYRYAGLELVTEADFAREPTHANVELVRSIRLGSMFPRIPELPRALLDGATGLDFFGSARDLDDEPTVGPVQLP
ncbi:MAG: hypothetical protein AAF645_01775 [Myxococcota bacterium]